MVPDYKNYAIEQIDNFLNDLLNDDEISAGDIATELNKILADAENYHQKQLTKIRKVKSALFAPPIQLQQDDTREMLYEEIKSSYPKDLFHN